jgi:D-arabinose 1-dehydrogenase-like Zn-dependent alcohol dehydrogenase
VRQSRPTGLRAPDWEAQWKYTKLRYRLCGAAAECVWLPEKYAVEVPEDLDPAEVVSLVFPT